MHALRIITCLFTILLIFFTQTNNSAITNTTRAYNRTITKKFSAKRPFKVMSANFAINTLGLISWYPFKAKMMINQACPWNDTDINGTCTETYNEFTLSFCQILTYFKNPVCGGLSCYFDASTGQCGGQCGNTVLEQCVSKVESPNDDSDCVCEISKANSNATYFDQQSKVLIINMPSCDASTCYGNSCSFFYVSVDRQSDNVLYAYCNNDKYNND